jgi:hypothetical protein
MLLRLNPLNEAEALEAPPFVALVGRLFFLPIFTYMLLRRNGGFHWFKS